MGSSEASERAGGNGHQGSLTGLPSGFDSRPVHYEYSKVVNIYTSGDPREAATSGGLDHGEATPWPVRPYHGRDAEQVRALLDSPEVAQLIDDLQATRWTGRPGYPIRAMVGMALTKTLYALPTWTRTVALVRDHAALRSALGCSDTDSPSVYACYRFAGKLRDYNELLDTCLDRVTKALHAQLPEYGVDIAIDGSDIPAYANGQRYVSKGGKERERYSDPDASWGHRSAISTRKKAAASTATSSTPRSVPEPTYP